MNRNGSNHVKSQLAIVGALLTLASPLALHGQSETGGLPATNARVTILEDTVVSLRAALNAETAARQALAVSLAAETAARLAAASTLQSNINNLQTNLNNAVNAINAESAARQAADTTLQSNLTIGLNNVTNAVNGENSARQAADTGLQNQIALLQNSATGNTYIDHKNKGNTPNGRPTVVLTSQILPTGNYHVLFTGVLHIGSSPADNGASCSLSQDGTSYGEYPTAVISFNGTVTISALMAVPGGSSGRITVTCDNGDHSDSEVDNMWLIAIPVANPHFQSQPNS